MWIGNVLLISEKNFKGRRGSEEREQKGRGSCEHEACEDAKCGEDLGPFAPLFVSIFPPFSPRMDGWIDDRAPMGFPMSIFL